jgi:hypothetical protein
MRFGWPCTAARVDALNELQAVLRDVERILSRSDPAALALKEKIGWLQGAKDEE